MGSKLALTILPLAVLSTLALVSDTAQAAPFALPSPLTFHAGPLGTLNVQG
ncbi:porin, partial [Acidithiobacillus ferrooxidans F221]|nr:porin [Acidithiobacillus ferrooxidans F221]